MYCEYYQARALREKTWFVMGVLRNEDNLVFYRALDKKNNIFECFVPANFEERFLDVMNELQKRGYVFDLQKKPNRLKADLEK